MDSGIKVEKGTVDKMMSMKKVRESPFDLLLMDILTIPGTTGSGTKSAPEHLIVTKEWPVGECENALEGTDLGPFPANFHTFRDYVLKELPEKCCMALMYFKYTNKENVPQEKLLAVNWVPDTAPMKLKMRYSSTFKTMCMKSPSLNGKVEAHDADDLSFKTVVESFTKS